MPQVTNTMSAPLTTSPGHEAGDGQRQTERARQASTSRGYRVMTQRSIAQHGTEQIGTARRRTEQQQSTEQRRTAHYHSAAERTKPNGWDGTQDRTRAGGWLGLVGRAFRDRHQTQLPESHMTGGAVVQKKKDGRGGKGAAAAAAAAVRRRTTAGTFLRHDCLAAPQHRQRRSLSPAANLTNARWNRGENSVRPVTPPQKSSTKRTAGRSSINTNTSARATHACAHPRERAWCLERS